MSLLSRNLITTLINPTQTHLRTPKFPLLLHSKPFLNLSRIHPIKPHFINLAKISSKLNSWGVQVRPLDLDATIVTESSDKNWDFNFDGILSVLELFCLVSSVAISVILVLNSGHKKMFFSWFGEKGLVWQCVVLVGGVVVGAVIRRRQWRRVCREDSFSKPVNLMERIEKLEEYSKNNATVIRVLSRQLEKLGIRFRVTRKALKEPIAETAALAQKNSEATRALAMQEDILEKELGEIQKVLLAMQDQQKKQLELILVIAKSGKLWDTKREENHGNNAAVASKSFVDGVPQETNEIEVLAGQKQSNNDQV